MIFDKKLWPHHQKERSFFCCALLRNVGALLVTLTFSSSALSGERAAPDVYQMRANEGAAHPPKPGSNVASKKQLAIDSVPTEQVPLEYAQSAIAKRLINSTDVGIARWSTAIALKIVAHPESQEAFTQKNYEPIVERSLREFTITAKLPKLEIARDAPDANALIIIDVNSGLVDDVHYSSTTTEYKIDISKDLGNIPLGLRDAYFFVLRNGPSQLEIRSIPWGVAVMALQGGEISRAAVWLSLSPYQMAQLAVGQLSPEKYLPPRLYGQANSIPQETRGQLIDEYFSRKLLHRFRDEAHFRYIEFSELWLRRAVLAILGIPGRALRHSTESANHMLRDPDAIFSGIEREMFQAALSELGDCWKEERAVIAVGASIISAIHQGRFQTTEALLRHGLSGADTQQGRLSIQKPRNAGARFQACNHPVGTPGANQYGMEK